MLVDRGHLINSHTRVYVTTSKIIVNLALVYQPNEEVLNCNKILQSDGNLFYLKGGEVLVRSDGFRLRVRGDN